MYTLTLAQMVGNPPLHKYQDNDMIKVSLWKTSSIPDGANVNAYAVQFGLNFDSVLAHHPENRWWKSCEIHTKWFSDPPGDMVANELWIQDLRVGDASPPFDPWLVSGNGYIVLKKAKLLGVHTPMYRVTNLDPNQFPQEMWHNAPPYGTSTIPPAMRIINFGWAWDGGENPPTEPF